MQRLLEGTQSTYPVCSRWFNVMSEQFLVLMQVMWEKVCTILLYSLFLLGLATGDMNLHLLLEEGDCLLFTLVCTHHLRLQRFQLTT